MKRIWLIVCLMILCIPALMSQEEFPKSWVGTWKGELSIINGAGQSDKIAMELQISPIESSSRYNWVIIYGEDKKADARNYELVPKVPDKGIYIIDEKNSIELESYLIGNKFLSNFDILKSRIMTCYEKRENKMLFEVISTGTRPSLFSGGGEVEKDKVPKVNSYAINVVQQAVLTRVVNE